MTNAARACYDTGAHPERRNLCILAPAMLRRRRPMASDTIDRLTEKFRTNRERFEAFCRSLSDEELERPVPDSTLSCKGLREPSCNPRHGAGALVRGRAPGAKRRGYALSGRLTVRCRPVQ